MKRTTSKIRKYNKIILVTMLIIIIDVVVLILLNILLFESSFLKYQRVKDDYYDFKIKVANNFFKVY